MDGNSLSTGYSSRRFPGYVEPSDSLAIPENQTISSVGDRDSLRYGFKGCIPYDRAVAINAVYKSFQGTDNDQIRVS